MVFWVYHQSDDISSSMRLVTHFIHWPLPSSCCVSVTWISRQTRHWTTSQIGNKMAVTSRKKLRLHMWHKTLYNTLLWSPARVVCAVWRVWHGVAWMRRRDGGRGGGRVVQLQTKQTSWTLRLTSQPLRTCGNPRCRTQPIPTRSRKLGDRVSQQCAVPKLRLGLAVSVLKSSS